MHLSDNTRPGCGRASRLWRTRNTKLIALAVIGVAGCVPAPRGYRPARHGPLEEVPEHLLARAEAGLTGPAEELPDNLVPSNQDIGDPKQVIGMTVRLLIGEELRLPNAPNQLVEYEPYSLRTLEISAAPGAVVEAWELPYALESDEDIDAGHDEIRRLSLSITRGAQGDSEKVRRLIRWVHSNLRYQKADMPRASDVLAVRVGDCTEYTHLFMALARSARIPVRRTVGLAYTEHRGQPAFGYHAWAEVALDGRWVPVDPTWNETVADATHIKLSDGWSTSWEQLVGNVEISVLDVVRCALSCESGINLPI